MFTLVFRNTFRGLLDVREVMFSELLVFRRHPDGQVTVDSFPDEVLVDDVLVEHYSELAPGLLYLDRGRLYIHAANGEAVYVPLGPSPLRDCTRYGRLYRRP